MGIRKLKKDPKTLGILFIVAILAGYCASILLPFMLLGGAIYLLVKSNNKKEDNK